MKNQLTLVELIQQQIAQQEELYATALREGQSGRELKDIVETLYQLRDTLKYVQSKYGIPSSSNTIIY